MQLESWLGDVRFAWRSALRRPAFTLLLVATLALGIGVNSAVFTLLDAVLLRPLPYPDPSRLVFVWQTLPEHNVLELEPTPFDYDAWRAVRSFAAVGLIANGAFTLTGDENPERVRGARVTARIRHRHQEAPATIVPLDDDRVRVIFDAPQIAIAPGQAVVMYDDDRVVGGGWID